MKRINLIVILGILGMTAFGCRTSSPPSQENQAPSTPPANSSLPIPEIYPTLSEPQAEPTPSIGETYPTPPDPQAYQTPPIPQGYPVFPDPQVYQAPPVPQPYPTFPDPQVYQSPPISQPYQTPPIPQANSAPVARQPNPAANTTTTQGLRGLPDGDYFYGELPETDKTGHKYLIFRKTGNLVTGQEYLFQTDQSNCFRGTADTNGIANVKVAYFELSREGTKWFFDERDSIKTSDFHRFSFEKAPDFASRNLQECINIFRD